MWMGAVAAAALTAAFCCVSPTAVSHQSTAELNYGAAVIAGGYRETSNPNDNYLNGVEVIHGDPLPDLPHATAGSSLSAVGSVLYSCGGNVQAYTPTRACYTLDTTSVSPEWQHNHELPVVMDYHSATTVGSHIWFIYEQMLYDLDTTTSVFTSHSLPFEVTKFHCAVSDDRHTYAIGVGTGSNEIWVNIFQSNPSSWEKLSVMETSRENMGCLLFGSEIFITGGYGSEGRVSIFDTESRVFHFSQDLNEPRSRHKMFVYEGRPAVVGGGFSASFLKSIESYNAASANWTIEDRELTEEKDNFGLAQIIF